MTDEIDRGQERDAEFLAIAMEEQQLRAAHDALPATGRCHYCHEPLDADLRFCDVECRDGFEYEQKLRKMQGVA